jgi:hypothetical protein
METTPSPRPIDAADSHPAQTVEIRARVPAQLRDQLDQLAGRSFRSLAGEVAAACSSWVDQHAKGTLTAPAIAAGVLMLAAAPALAQTCGPLGSPYGIGGCVVPGNSTTPPVRIYSDPLNPGGFRSAPVAPAPTFNRPMPPGLNRDYSQPGVPGLY